MFTVILVSVIVSCDNSFEPLAEKENYFFSMYGYLDASADTQWVRVAPARVQLEMGSVVPDMRVTLEDVENGSTVVMKDSISQLRNGVNILNFWTTTDIKLGASYRLEAERPAGSASSAEVTIPEVVPGLRIEYLVDSLRASLAVRNVERLADIQTVWNVRIQSGALLRKRTARFPHRNRATNGSSDSYNVFLNIGQECDQLILPEGTVEVTGVDIFAATGGPEWIEDIESISDLEYALPEGFSNVENGVGYVVGIASTTIPYEKMIEYQRCNENDNL